jgi:uroporphyrinogen-III decarboxylase
MRMVVVHGTLVVLAMYIMATKAVAKVKAVVHTKHKIVLALMNQLARLTMVAHGRQVQKIVLALMNGVAPRMGVVP